MRNLICIVCPRGCHLTVDEDNDYKVSGNTCMRGEAYGMSECIAPKRVITSTVKLIGNDKIKRLPVRTNGSIPKEKIFEVMGIIDNIAVTGPVMCGEVIYKDILGLGVDLVSSRNV